SASGIVEKYLTAIVGHDWHGLGECVTDDVERVGPFGDTYRGRGAYVGYISSLMPTLPGYSMDITRVTYADNGRLAFAELTETVEVGGRPHITPETLVFDVFGERIARITIYIQRLEEKVPTLAAPKET